MTACACSCVHVNFISKIFQKVLIESKNSNLSATGCVEDLFLASCSRS